MNKTITKKLNKTITNKLNIKKEMLYNDEVYEYLLGEGKDLSKIGFIITIKLGQKTIKPINWHVYFDIYKCKITNILSVSDKTNINEFKLFLKNIINKTLKISLNKEVKIMIPKHYLKVNIKNDILHISEGKMELIPYKLRDNIPKCIKEIHTFLSNKENNTISSINISDEQYLDKLNDTKKKN